MIKVTYGNNVSKQEDIVDAGTTLKAFLENHNIDYTEGSMHLDGASLLAGDLYKTFADHGVSDHCFLLKVVKADNGIA